MADFSLTTLFVVPASQTALPTGSSTQNLTTGQVGIFTNKYVGTVTPSGAPYFYVAQGRENTYLQGSKRSDKIAGVNASTNRNNVTEWYKISGCETATTQITEVTNFNVHCGEDVTLTLRAHSSYLDTLYFNGFTRSVTVQAPCCDCGADPCDTVDESALIDQLIEKLMARTPGINSDNISLSQFYTFEKVAEGLGFKLVITGKALTAYGNPCDIAAFPFEYDRMYFRTFIYSGPATTADFIVADNCNIVAEANVIQTSNYPRGTAGEIAQLEKNYYSYQAGYMKHLFRMAGYNQNFESFVVEGEVYSTYYIKMNDLDLSAGNWGDYVSEDSMVIIAVITGSDMDTDLEAALVDGLGIVVDQAGACITTTSTTTL